MMAFETIPSIDAERFRSDVDQLLDQDLTLGSYPRSSPTA